MFAHPFACNNKTVSFCKDMTTLPCTSTSCSNASECNLEENADNERMTVNLTWSGAPNTTDGFRILLNPGATHYIGVAAYNKNFDELRRCVRGTPVIDIEQCSYLKHNFMMYVTNLRAVQEEDGIWVNWSLPETIKPGMSFHINISRYETNMLGKNSVYAAQAKCY